MVRLPAPRIEFQKARYLSEVTLTHYLEHWEKLDGPISTETKHPNKEGFGTDNDILNKGNDTFDLHNHHFKNQHLASTISCCLSVSAVFSVTGSFTDFKRVR